MDHHRKPVVSPDSALASDLFDQFCAANTLKSILGIFRHLCDILHIKPTNFPQFYPKLKSKLRSWKAQALWNKFDKRASHKCYNRGKACQNTRVLIIGGGPCGMRAAIEAQLLGAKVVVVEKRDRMSRNNVLHLWPFVIQDLRGLGAKKFFGKFCAGSIDHISIRQLQCILLKIGLIFGVEIHEGVSFESIIPPPDDQSERIGWRASILPADHPVSQYEFDVLIGADGRRNTLEGFKRKEFRGKLAIAITANFINRHSEAEARVEEISGVAFIFNQKFFKDLYAATGIDLENIVYYKDETHYFVMTAKKHSLLDKGVILNDYADTARLLGVDNVNKDALEQYAREAADFSTNYKLPNLEFAVNHYGQPDVAMFDFTSMYAAENASRVVEKNGHKMLMALVGDSLLEPFWPTGSGCARGFLSSMDACWAIRSWGLGNNPLEVLSERESIYRILGQTTPENLQRDLASYTLDPITRYPNLNSRCVVPIQVRTLYDTDNTTAVEEWIKAPTAASHEQPKKRRRRDTQVHPDTLLRWFKKQVALYNTIHVEDMSSSFKDGMALCAIIHRYRPDLIDFHSLNPQEIAKNNQLAFDTLERELGIYPVMTGLEMEQCEIPDRLAMLSYLSQIYDTFRGEIPHIKHPKLEDIDLPVRINQTSVMNERLRNLAQMSTANKVTAVSRLVNQNTPTRKRHSTATPRTDTLSRKNRKRRSGTIEKDRRSPNQEWRDWHKTLDDIEERRLERIKTAKEIEQNRLERQKCIKDIEKNRQDRMMKRRYLRHLATQQFKKSMQMLQGNAKDESDNSPFEDYSLFVYRQTAPDFKDRVKDLEMKLLYPDREARLHAELKKASKDEKFSGRVKEIEAMLKGSPGAEKKPKDLLRAIGKIEKTDWNLREIEKKIEENKHSKGKGRTERVPKWSRQQFDDKFSAMERKLKAKGGDDAVANKYSEIDVNIKQLEKKIKEGNVLEPGKVSALAAHLANMNQKPEKPILQKSTQKPALVLPAQGGSEMCHFCNKRVYLMERLNAEGRFFHRGCFRCEYCSTTLRLGSYAFDRDGKFGSRFFCTQHFGLPGTQRMRVRRKSEEFRMVTNKENIPTQNDTDVPDKDNLPTPMDQDSFDRGTTPERIEFKNLSGVVDTSSDLEDAEITEMDEDEWTDRNFGASAAEGSSDEVFDLSDSEEEEEFAEALDVNVGMTDETIRLAKNWTHKHSQKPNRALEIGNNTDVKKDDDESGSCHDSDDSREHFSYQEYDSEDDESDTATDNEQEAKARELRKQEVRLEVPEKNSDSGSDTEIASDEYTTSSGSEEETEEENSATEIETDSEFEHDTTPIHHNIPDIIISETVQVKRGCLEEPKKVQVFDKVLVGNAPVRQKDIKLEFTPLIPDKPGINLILKNNNNGPSPLINPRPGDYLLNRTQSTEGIASKISLELKKKYLLGPSGLAGNVRKSGSTSTIDTRFKSVVDQISEHQKLLNPAPEITPTMQAILQGADKLKNSPTILPSPIFIDRKQKELPGIKDFTHVCNLKDKDTEDTDSNLQNNKEIVTKEVIQQDTKDNLIDNQTVNNDESRPRSPVHETSIIVPELKNIVPESHDIETDSISSDMSSTEEESDDKYQNQITVPPKVEIHNSKGELMEDEDVKLTDSQKNKSLNNLNRNIPDVCQHITPNLKALNKDDIQLLPKNIDKDGGTFNKIISVPIPSSDNALDRGQILKQVSTPAELFVGDKEIITSGQSSPSSPVSIRDDESFKNESIIAALTETELSDWARDEDAVVSENFDDLEFNINEKFITFRKHQKPRNKRNARGVAAKIARTEDFEDDYTHICGKVDKVPPPSNLLINTDNIEFMDTGDKDESSTDEFSQHNRFLKNSGYTRFVNPSENEDITPIIEIPPPIEEDINTGEANEDTTTSEAVTTIIDSPLDATKYFHSEVLSSPTLLTPVQDYSSKTYEEYVQRLQGRISPFCNVRDSIDIRKSKKHNKIIDIPKTQNITEEGEEAFTTNSSPKSPTTSRKLEELSRERSKQKDLIHEMVLEKLLSHGKSPQDRKHKRNSRSSPSPRGGSQNSITSLAKEEVEKVLAPMEIRALSRSPERLKPSEEPNQKIVFDQEKIFIQRDQSSDLNENKDLATPVNDGSEIFYTPMTSFKKQAEKRSRPLSMHSSFHINENSSDKNSSLPVTPLTNPEAFSLPDIRKALFDSNIETPVPPPRSKGNDRDQAREIARIKAKLMTDEELGLSPEEKIKLLKEKVNRRYVRSESAPSTSDNNATPLKESSISKTIEVSPPIDLLIETQHVMEEKISTYPEPVGLACPDQQTSPGTSTEKLDSRSPVTSPITKSGMSLDLPSGKKSKDRERRKSIIQAVSDFFHKKSPGTSPPKSAPPSSSSHSGTKFGKFRLIKSKDKSKSANNSDSEDSDEKLSPTKKDHPIGVKSTSEAEIRRRLIDEAPPVPPPPMNYEPHHRQSEESLSEVDVDEDSRVTYAPGSDVEAAAARKRIRMSRKIERQAQLKRLRMAQEVQRQLEELEVKQRELETRGVDLEKTIRSEESGSGVKEDSELMKEWFALMRERSELRRYEKELMVRAQEMELEDRHARLQNDLRESLAKDDKAKTEEEVAKEGRILREMLQIVERRDALIALLEEDRQRYKEEDKDLEAQMLAKGLRLTSLRKKDSSNI
uniref:F-actin monooxygenase n=1 Tax=Clastoptera arizonana TaxID=38151 RepID=A0A1B6D4D3_9HEMI